MSGRRGVLIVAAAVAVIFALPHVCRPLLLPRGGTYTAFGGRRSDCLSFDETILYGAQTNYVARTLRPPFDAGLFEYQGVPALVPVLPYYLAVPIVRLLGSTERAFIALDVVLPTSAFLLFVRLLRASRLRPVGAAAVALVALIPAQAPRNSVRSVLALVGVGSASSQPLEYSRFIAPAFSFTLLVAGVFLLVRGRSRASAVLAGVCGAGMFYTYLFTWVVFLPGAALVCLRRSLVSTPAGRKVRPDSPSCLALATTLILGIPFAVQYFAFVRGPGYRGVTERMVWTIGRVPDSKTVSLSVVFGILSWAAWRWSAGRERVRELVLFATGGLVAFNGQLVLGRTMESFHLANRFFQPFLALILGALLVSRFWRRHPVGARRVAGTAVVAILALGCIRQMQAASKGAMDFLLSDRDSDLFRTLDGTPTPCVMLTSDEELNYRLPTQTHCFPYLPLGVLTVATNEELGWRFGFTRKLLGYDVGSTARLLSPQSMEPEGRGWAFHLFKVPSLAAEDAARRADGWNRIDLESGLRRFRIDLVLVKPEDPVSVARLESYGFEMVASGSYGTLLSPTAIARGISKPHTTPAPTWAP